MTKFVRADFDFALLIHKTPVKDTKSEITLLRAVKRESSMLGSITSYPLQPQGELLALFRAEEHIFR
jgi:hypothetical protein